MALPLLILAACLGSCGSVQKITDLKGTTGTWYAVTTAQTPFYRYGPQQGSGPDQQLTKGAIMKVIRPSFGYVKVQLQDGQNGYVASEDIRPAPATLVAEKLAPPLGEPGPLIANHEEQFQLNSNDPRLIAPPEPLPEPDPVTEPTPIPEHP
jgi:hypothetical protein